MSVNRVPDLAEGKLDSALTQLEQQITDLRAGAPQFIGGASIKFFRSETANQFDWSGKLSDPSGIGIGGKLFLVTATAQNTSIFWGNLFNALYVNSSSTAYDGLAYLTDLKNGATSTTTAYTDAPNSSVSPNAKSWFVQFSGDSTKNLWVKFWVYGIDQATLTVTALN